MSEISLLLTWSLAFYPLYPYSCHQQHLHQSVLAAKPNCMELECAFNFWILIYVLSRITYLLNPRQYQAMGKECIWWGAEEAILDHWLRGMFSTYMYIHKCNISLSPSLTFLLYFSVFKVEDMPKFEPETGEIYSSVIDTTLWKKAPYSLGFGAIDPFRTVRQAYIVQMRLF